MSKYKSKEVDYAYCEPTIERALRNGDAIWCYVCDIESDLKECTRERVIVHFNQGLGMPYISDNGTTWGFARPVPSKVPFVKDAVSIMKILVADGYKPEKDGTWKKSNEVGFNYGMWQHCEGPQPTDRHLWLDEWLEYKDAEQEKK